MRNTDTLEVYSKLREGFEEKEAKVITIAIESAIQEADKSLLEQVATKEDIAVTRQETKQDIAVTRQEIVNLRVETKQDIAATRQEIVNLRAEIKEDMANLRAEFKTDIANLRTELKTDMANLRTEVKADIGNFRADIIRWMFIFWIGQTGVIFGIVYGIVRFVK